MQHSEKMEPEARVWHFKVANTHTHTHILAGPDAVTRQVMSDTHTQTLTHRWACHASCMIYTYGHTGPATTEAGS